MIRFYQLFLDLIWLFKPFFKFFPHEKVRFFFQNEGRIRCQAPILDRPIWIHASSGEIEYAKSVVRELKKMSPTIPLLVTHTSMSSQKAVSLLGVEAWGVAPFDTAQDVQAFLKKWNPRACLIARTDLWPQTLIELHRAQIPTYLFSATFARGSKKVSYFSRKLLKKALPLLTKIYFVSQADFDVCRDVFPSVNGEVLGDTRYDQVAFRLAQANPVSLQHRPQTLIAGSTWTEDEKVLLPAFGELKNQNWKLILVPHEVDAHHIASVTKTLQALSLNFHLYSKGLDSFSWDRFDVLVIDQVGLLASLYPLADVAFIGGSFRRQVHSVMEALAALKPVIVGPFYENNREAIEFKEKGFVRVVEDVKHFEQATLNLYREADQMKLRLASEIQARQGVTEKLIKALQAQEIFAKTPRI